MTSIKIQDDWGSFIPTTDPRIDRLSKALMKVLFLDEAWELISPKLDLDLRYRIQTGPRSAAECLAGLAQTPTGIDDIRQIRRILYKEECDIEAREATPINVAIRDAIREVVWSLEQLIPPAWLM